MLGSNTSVFAIFDRSDAESAVTELEDAGFRNEDISCLLADNKGSKDFAHEKHTKAPEAGAAGAITGAVLGGALGWLTGFGALVIPGVGPLIAAGPLLSAFAGVGVGGAIGGLAGGLIGLGIPEYEAKRYQGMITEGKVLLSVHCDDFEWTSRAKSILRHCNGKHIASSGEPKGDKPYTNTKKPFPKYQNENDTWRPF